MRRWLAACLLVWGCGGSSGGGVPAGACTFTATIDGTGWVASPGSASNEGSVLDVFGSDSGEDLVIALGEPATGTFGTATSGLVELKLTIAGSDASWTASNGHGSATITVTELTTSHATGSFAGTLAIDGTGSGSAETIGDGVFDCAL